MKILSLIVLALVVAISGCKAQSHLTVGPATLQSSASAHEWRDTDFYAEDGKIGSTLGFLSSEIGGKLGECEELSFGAGISWAKSPVEEVENTVVFIDAE